MLNTITLGPLLLTAFLQLILGFFVAFWLLAVFSRRSKLDLSAGRGVLEGSFLIGLISARLVYAATNWNAYVEAPWSVLLVWQPGFHPIAGIAIAAGYFIWRIWRIEVSTRWAFGGAALSSVAVTAILLIGVNATVGLFSDPDILRDGDRFPDFALQTIDGDAVRLSNFAGRPVVLNFWATWCSPCRREMPLLNAAHLQYADQGLAVLGLAVNEPASVVQPFIDATGVQYPIMVDVPGDDGPLSGSASILAMLGQKGLPTTVFLNSGGVIRRIYVGELSWAYLADQITKLWPG
jgi:peroxiredoxin